ncbi:MAG: nitrous oxide reductase accessory protein NosL [Flavobacteriales bacterium]|nr:nitrous oxide reductase accessory protein NosL [Flavobacteriales bacterium]
MSITDQRYGTEIVTEKGKIYTFDSIECMIDYTEESGVKAAQQLVTSILNPGVLIDAKGTFVIKCKAMPSPMGRYLTAFPSKEEAQKIIDEKGGEILPWDEAFKSF